jgi:CelD/BcsL family acetyltransferase involved in cellulose biosynthesis
MTPTLQADPACPDAPTSAVPDRADDRGANDPWAGRRPSRPLVAERRSIDSIRRETWDGLAAANPWATPFSSWPFHRAWWDAFGTNAHEETVVVSDPDAAAGAPPVAIVPLMHRHEVEPDDEATRTTMRHGSAAQLTPVAPTAKAIFFGASYHADYATVLGSPADLPAVTEAIADYLSRDPAKDPEYPVAWDVVDLRRIRCNDPAATELGAAFARREIACGWTLNIERDDVCPVATFPAGIDFEGYLATLEKKVRHEIRRKIRRAERAGEVQLEESDDPLADLPDFIDLHGRKWGAKGLFPPTPGGDQSRRFFHRLFELSGPDGPVHLSFLTIDGRRVGAGIHLETEDSYLYYNAGVDPAASALSPGVVMTARYVEAAIVAGKRRFDFLRGNEPYKYEWGAVDEPIQRLLVRRDVGRHR